jgi:hypothetical protein
MPARDINFLRRQAELCIALSRATFDLTIAGRLRAMAEEFRARAAQWEDDLAEFQPQGFNGTGSHTGSANRN